MWGIDLRGARQTIEAQGCPWRLDGGWGWNGSRTGCLQMCGCSVSRTQKLDIEGRFLVGGTGFSSTETERAGRMPTLGEDCSEV